MEENTSSPSWLQNLTVDELSRIAQQKLPKAIFEYFYGGSDDEITLRDNKNALQRIQLIPRALVDVSDVSTKTTILGREVAFPIILAPTGRKSIELVSQLSLQRCINWRILMEKWQP
jgi:isopentenyl diphosphate isomerase/L-lactate dehydrogenase-like FMN-dependent dehydrogenase